MKDIDGKQIKVGDTVKLLCVDAAYMSKLPDDEKPILEGMINKEHRISELIEEDNMVGFSYEKASEKGVVSGTLYADSYDVRLKKDIAEEKGKTFAKLLVSGLLLLIGVLFTGVFSYMPHGGVGTIYLISLIAAIVFVFNVVRFVYLCTLRQ